MSGVQAAYSRNLLAMAGIGRSPADTGRTVVDVLKRTAPAVVDGDTAEQLRLLRLRVDQAVEILQSFRHHDEARQEAFKALTGTELLVEFGEASCGRS